MAEEQISLFENELFGRAESSGLVLRSRPDRPLTKAQRAFNRLVAQVEQLRAGIDQETLRLDEALAYYGEHLHPRMQRQKELRKTLVRALAPFLKDKRLKTKSERKTLRIIIAEQLNAVLGEEGSMPNDLRELFKQVHGVDFEQAERQGVAQLRSMMEELFDEFGIDMDMSDLRPDMSDEELAVKAAEMAQRIQQMSDEEEPQFRGAERPKTKRQLDKEERMRQAEEMRKKSIATIYKQLAKVLHPDLEPNPEARQRKGALMQELTIAYRNNDLHTLLRLELEWIHREKGDMERLTEEKLAIYNEVLKEQIVELKQELDEIPYHPRYKALVVMDGPFGARLRTGGPEEARELDETMSFMEETIARMGTNESLEEVRDAIRAYRAANRASRRAERWAEDFDF